MRRFFMNEVSYRGTSLTRNCNPQRRPMPRVLGGSYGGPRWWAFPARPTGGAVSPQACPRVVKAVASVDAHVCSQVAGLPEGVAAGRAGVGALRGGVGFERPPETGYREIVCCPSYMGHLAHKKPHPPKTLP